MRCFRPFDGYPFEIFIAEWKDEKVELAKLKTPKDVHVSKDLIWMPGKSEICFLGEEKSRAKVYSTNVEDETSRVLTKGDVVIDHYSFRGTDGSLIAIQSELTYATDIVYHAPNTKQ